MAKAKTKQQDRIDDFEIEEIAGMICGIDVDAEDYEQDQLDEPLDRLLGVDFQQFCDVVKALWPLIDLGISPLTNSALIGLLNRKDGIWLAKRDITSQFMGHVIEWGTEGNPPKKMGAGFIKTITDENGIPEYEVTVKRAVYLDMDYLNDEKNKGKIFASGVCRETALHNEDIHWIAKVGDGANDWAIYYGHADDTKAHIKVHGIKVRTEGVIRKLVPCSDEALARYRH